MSETRVLLHVGYPKTGTTFLQQRVFCPSSVSWCPLDRRRARGVLVLPGAFEYDRDEAERYIERELARPEMSARVPVLSHEGLVDVLWGCGVRSHELACRLHDLLATRARVLIVVREQVSQILSHFSQYRREGGTLSLSKFLLTDSLPVQPGAAVFQRTAYEYDKLVRLYRDLFGPQGSLVLTYEQLARDPREFLERLYEFMEIPVSEIEQVDRGYRTNSSFNPARLLVRRMTTRFETPTRLRPNAHDVPAIRWGMRSVERATDALIPESLHRRMKERWQDLVRQEVADHYTESNRSLAAITGLHLTELGYRL